MKSTSNHKGAIFGTTIIAIGQDSYSKSPRLKANFLYHIVNSSLMLGKLSSSSSISCIVNHLVRARQKEVTAAKAEFTSSILKAFRQILPLPPAAAQPQAKATVAAEGRPADPGESRQMDPSQQAGQTGSKFPALAGLPVYIYICIYRRIYIYIYTYLHIKKREII